tara:strand:- start:15 stop:257 length:243 start_codon:yes stop_codon:yes gene_type:complete
MDSPVELVSYVFGVAFALLGLLIGSKGSEILENGKTRVQYSFSRRVFLGKKTLILQIFIFVGIWTVLIGFAAFSANLNFR